MERKGDTKIPEFKSLEEEREYWEARGPLAEGHKGRLNKSKPGQKRSSFLVVRLTGEELTRLRDMAAEQGLGPSTFARLILMAALENVGKMPRCVTWDQLKDTLAESLPPQTKEKAEAIAKKISIGDPSNPAFILIDGSKKNELEDFTWSWLSKLLAIAGVQVLTPENERYEKVKAIVSTQM